MGAICQALHIVTAAGGPRTGGGILFLEHWGHAYLYEGGQVRGPTLGYRSTDALDDGSLARS